MHVIDTRGLRGEWIAEEEKSDERGERERANQREKKGRARLSDGRFPLSRFQSSLNLFRKKTKHKKNYMRMTAVDDVETTTLDVILLTKLELLKKSEAARLALVDAGEGFDEDDGEFQRELAQNQT